MEDVDVVDQQQQLDVPLEDYQLAEDEQPQDEPLPEEPLPEEPQHEDSVLVLNLRFHQVN